MAEPDRKESDSIESVSNDSDGRELQRAHADGDSYALCDLYAQQADFHESAGDTDACCFFLTHALVYGLESDHPNADTLRHRLARYGRCD